MPRTRILILSGDRAVSEALSRGADEAACVCSVITPEWDLGAALSAFRPDLTVIDGDALGTDPLTILDRSAHHIKKTPLIIRSTREPRLVGKLCAHLTSLGFVIEQRLGAGDARADLAAALVSFQSRGSRITAAELLQAMELNELVVNYQPKIRLEGSRPIIGAEALIRWKHPMLGMLGAWHVVTLAERSRLHWRLTEWVLDKALDFATLTEDLGLHLRVAVNVPADFVAEPHFGAVVATALERHDVDPANLCLEITETTAMREGPAITGSLTALRLRGVHLSIDDFGTGYSSLIQLHRLPFDELKIDQSFIRDFPQDETSAAIVSSTLSLCERLGLEVCAEGIETAAAADELQRLGCHIAQGYYFGKPMPAREFIQACQATAHAAKSPRGTSAGETALSSTGTGPSGDASDAGDESQSPPASDAVGDAASDAVRKLPTATTATDDARDESQPKRQAA